MQVTAKFIECMHSTKWIKRIIFIAFIAQTTCCCCCCYECSNIESFKLIDHFFFRGLKTMEYVRMLQIVHRTTNTHARTHANSCASVYVHLSGRTPNGVAKKWRIHLTGNKHKWQTSDILLTIIHHFINFDVAAH